MGFSSCLGQVGFYVYWWPSHLQATHPQDPFLSRQVWEQIRLILLQRDLGDHTTGGASHTKALPCIPVNFASTLCFPPLHASWKKQESSRKASISALLSMPKPLTVWITINRGKFWKRWEYQTTWSASWEICMQVRKQQLELDMEQQTGSK